MYVHGFRNTAAFCNGQIWSEESAAEQNQGKAAAYLGDKPSLHERHRNRAVFSRVSGPSGIVTTRPKMSCGYNDVFRGRHLLTSRVHTNGVAWETQYPLANNPLWVER